MAAIYARMQKQHHPPRWRQYRRRLGAVLATYAALVPVSVAFVALSPRRHTNGFLADVVVGHFLLCALLAVVISLANATLEVFGRGKRFRLRTEAFLRLFALWPALAAFAWAGVALLR